MISVWYGWSETKYEFCGLDFSDSCERIDINKKRWYDNGLGSRRFADWGIVWRILATELDQRWLMRRAMSVDGDTERNLIAPFTVPTDVMLWSLNFVEVLIIDYFRKTQEKWASKSNPKEESWIGLRSSCDVLTRRKQRTPLLLAVIYKLLISLCRVDNRKTHRTLASSRDISVQIQWHNTT